MMMASSSSSSSSLASSWLYHVFLSFRGEDVRKGFLSHVLKEFKGKGIIVFIDNEIKRGQFIGPVLVGAIRQSRVAVVLLSRNYASSSWCLDELVEIMKCREEVGQTVMTIFYQVDPSEVRKQTGDFGKAFEKTCLGKTEEVKQAWRQALFDVAGIAGYDTSNCEADLINKITSDVTAVLGFTPSKDFDDFVGIGARITEIKSKLIFQSENVKVIGILGPAGIGKTTTARVLYNQLSPGFPFSTFLEDIRGSYEKPRGNDYRLKLHFQKNLLSQIFNKGDIEVHHLGRAQEMLSDKKVLVVLDEVDNWWQLEEMAKQRRWVGPGSMIIITTEDRKLLKAFGLGIDHIYKMKYPTSDESLQIFCQHAFGKNYPDDGFESLAREVTWLAGDLPLGLRVMGSYLRGMSRDEWMQALPWLRSTLDREIESTLRFSYDALRDNERTLFLHLACFFAGFEVNSVKRCFANSSLEVNHGLDVLAQKSLIFIRNGFIQMHSLLQQMGRQIVKIQSMKNPGKPLFLTDINEISDVLDEDTATGNVGGIMLCTSETIQISKSAFQGMKNLQFLYFDSNTTTCTPEGLDCLPNKLILLHWNGCPLRVWPSKFSGKFLVELVMHRSKFEMLWEGTKPLPCLKILDLSYSWNLKRIPNLAEATNLEELVLHDCQSLSELPNSIANATKLYRLDISWCSNIEDFPIVSDSILELVLCDTGIKEIPPWIENLFRLRKLIMHGGCEKLKTISPNISKLENLELLALRNIPLCAYVDHFKDGDDPRRVYHRDFFEAEIKWGPDFKHSWTLRSDLDIHYILPMCLPEKALTSPISLRLRGDSIKTIPDCITRLSGLIKLDVQECRELVALPPLPQSLQSLDANFFNLKGNAGELLQTSACKNAVLLGEEVPAHFTHRARSDFITINLNPRPLPSSFRFKACILLSAFSFKVFLFNDDDDDDDDDDDEEDDEEGESSLKGMSYYVRGKQNGLTVGGGPNQLHHMPALYGYREHLYIFEDAFTLNQDCPEAEETTFSELSFEFIVHDKPWKVKGCGVRLLESNNESAGGEDDEDDDGGDDDDEGGDDDDDGEDDEGGDDDSNTNNKVEDSNDNDSGFSDAGNTKANNETEGGESRSDEDEETWSRKRMRLSCV